MTTRWENISKAKTKYSNLSELVEKLEENSKNSSHLKAYSNLFSGNKKDFAEAMRNFREQLLKVRTAELMEHIRCMEDGLIGKGEVKSHITNHLVEMLVFPTDEYYISGYSFGEYKTIMKANV